MDPLAAPPPRRPRGLIGFLIVALLVATGIAAYALFRDEPQGVPTDSPTPAADLTPEEEDENLLDRVLDAIGDLGGGDGAGFGGDIFECLAPEDLLSGLLSGPGPRAPAAVVRTVSRQVERIRELSFDEAVRPRFLPGGEVARRVQEQLIEEYPTSAAAADERLLTALGAIPPGTDLRNLLERALGAQVAGFYDPDTGELVVRAGRGGIGTVARITLAHELEHALADQALGIPIPRRVDPEREDADLAAIALVEGDATLTMQRYALSLSFEEQLELFDPSALLEAQAGLDGLPHLLRRELLFPYEDGMAFVCDLFARGGWQAVNQAYREPPRTTAEVLFPDRYPAQEPVDLADPPDPGDGWRDDQARPLGAATLLWLFEAPGGDASRGIADALDAVRAWEGGEVHLWRSGGDTAVAIALASGDGALCGAVEEWYRAAFPVGRDADVRGDEVLALDGAGQDAVLRCPAGEVRLGIAPDLEVARGLAG